MINRIVTVALLAAAFLIGILSTQYNGLTILAFVFISAAVITGTGRINLQRRKTL